ncbi:MAG: hypothetical protein SPK05_07800, partial [Eubacteriales bacterium]|nr:hypothetical protein [Eubacteriales bacterium]
MGTAYRRRSFSSRPGAIPPEGDGGQPPKKQEAFYEAYRMELTHYEAAGRYLDGVMNGRTGIPL